MRTTYYTLDGHEPIPCDDVLQWGSWFESHTADRIVKRDGDEKTGWWVSTVFLGIDHNFGANGPPVLFETLVFAPKTVPHSLRDFDGYQRRYTTWSEAEAGHAEIVRRLAVALELGADV